MATACGKITKNQLKNCATLITDGNESTLYLANREDITGYVRDAVNPQIIRGITMKVGTNFYKIEGARKTLKPKWTSVKKNFATRYRHEIDGVIFNWDSTVKLEVEQFNEGVFVAIIVNKNKVTDASVEVFGTDVGMVAKDGMIRDVNSPDFGANLPIGLISDEEQEEPHVPASFAIDGVTPGQYSYTATMAALEALTIPAVA